MLNKGKAIYVDVDGTLHIDGVVNDSLIIWMTECKQEGFELILWSARGSVHAKRIAEGLGIVDMFKYILSKPMYVVDDKGWTWTKYVNNLFYKIKGTPEP